MISSVCNDSWIHGSPTCRYWSNDSELGLERTATAFRLLRTHGFDVNEDRFKRFYKDGEFKASEKAEPGSDDVSAMLNLLRASQTLFPGESVLKEARTFTRSYLKRKQESNECGDLAGEVMVETLIMIVLFAMDSRWTFWI